MDFSSFKTELLLDLKKRNKNCLKLIERNTKIIQEYLGENGNPKTIDNFVFDLNTLILQFKHKYNLFEKVLNHTLFTEVLKSFKNSNVLIEACKIGKKELIVWLLKMNINPCIQDENGMTALMYAVKNQNLLFAVKSFINNEDCLNLLDKNGDNALFHARYNNVIFQELVNSNIDINYINRNNENFLIYCCKNDIFSAVKILANKQNLDVNFADIEGMTPIMYLAMKGRNEEFSLLAKRSNLYCRSINNESILSILINKLYCNPDELFANYLLIIPSLVSNDYNFNLPVDDVGNSALMVFMIINDLYTSLYITRRCRTIDLSVKNSFGESPTSLCLKLKNNEALVETFKNHPTFDYNYVDPNTNNTLLMLCSMARPSLIKDIIEDNVNRINEVNNRNENALILATKCNNFESVKILLKNNIYVNQQDYLGNTALYYAVDLHNLKIIQLLINNNGDINIKNNEGVSPLNLAHEIGNKYILNILTNPTDSILKEDINIESEISPEEKYKETFEYLYPCINSTYPRLEMTYPLECLIKSIYSGEVKKVNYNTANGILPYSRYEGSTSGAIISMLM